MEARSSKVVKVSDTLALGLHEDVLVEILSKLPVKSLLKFRCVSQEWYALTKSSSFIARHFVHRSRCSDESRPCLLLLILSLAASSLDDLAASSQDDLAASSQDDCKQELGISLLNDEETTFLGLPFLWNHIITSQIWGFHLVGSSNGLVLFDVYFWIENENLNSTTETIQDFASRRRDLIIVWNPATEQFRCLPEPNLELESNIGLELEDVETTCHLLGFDFVHDHDISEYKLARVIYHGGDDPKDDGEVLATFEAEVFIQSRNSWRQVKDKLRFPSCKNCFQSTVTTLNGVLYWKVEQTSDECYVLSFNLREELFNVIQLPTDIRYLNRDDCNWAAVPLFSWKESPAIVVSDYSANDDPHIVVWVMSANEESKSGTQLRTPAWVQQSRIKLSVLAESKMLGVWKDQLLLTSYNKNADVADDDLFLYDPRSETKRNILKHAERNIKFRGVVKYEESLFPV